MYRYFWKFLLICLTGRKRAKVVRKTLPTTESRHTKADKPFRSNSRNVRASMSAFTCGLPCDNGKNAAESMVLNGYLRFFISARRRRASGIALYVFELNRTRHNHVGRIDFRFFWISLCCDNWNGFTYSC